MKIVGYTRISVDLEEDKRDNTSIENQKRIIREFVKKEFPDIETEIVNISTKGDEIIDRPLEKIGGKGVFTDAIESALLEKRIDFAAC